MNSDLLTRLRELQKVRGDLKAFANHDEFLPWSDSVSPLLEFDQNLHKNFIFWSDLVKSNYRMGKEHHDALGEAIGVVNQAITKLEIQPPIKTRPAKQIELTYPKKITLKWLFQHSPMSLWSWLVGLLVAAFLLGIAFTETPLYKNQTQKQASHANEVSKT